MTLLLRPTYNAIHLFQGSSVGCSNLAVPRRPKAPNWMFQGVPSSFEVFHVNISQGVLYCFKLLLKCVQCRSKAVRLVLIHDEEFVSRIRIGEGPERFDHELTFIVFILDKFC